MSLLFKSNLRVFIHRESIDLRAGFDRLTNLVVDKFNSQLVDGDLFIFFGKSLVKLQTKEIDDEGTFIIGNASTHHGREREQLYSARHFLRYPIPRRLQPPRLL